MLSSKYVLFTNPCKPIKSNSIQKIERHFYKQMNKTITQLPSYFTITLYSILKMSTRSGIVYAQSKVANRKLAIEIPTTPASTEVRRSPRFHKKMCPTDALLRRSARITKTSLPIEVMRELCNDVDYDSTSDYEEEQEQEEEEPEVQAPKYEVIIDFDEASSAWRANKRRVGESWVYLKTYPTRQNKRTKAEESSSIADRVKSTRRQTK